MEAIYRREWLEGRLTVLLQNDLADGQQGVRGLIDGGTNPNRLSLAAIQFGLRHTLPETGDFLPTAVARGNLQHALSEAMIGLHAMIFLTTSPATSVSRKLRPLWK